MATSKIPPVLKQALFKYWDTQYGIQHRIFFEYESEAYLTRLLQYGLGYFYQDHETLGTDLKILDDPYVLNGLIAEWIELFKPQRVPSEDLTGHDLTVANWVDTRYGAKAGCTFDDYDSGNGLFRFVQETVSCKENLTLGCGVGPLNRALVQWIQNFEAQSKPIS